MNKYKAYYNEKKLGKPMSAASKAITDDCLKGLLWVVVG